MNYRIRTAKLNDVNGQLTIKANITVETGYPLFIMDNEDVKRYTYDDKTKPQVTDPTNILKDEVYKQEKGEDRFTLSCTVESPINSDRISFYYDAKYNNVLIVPDLTDAGKLQPTCQHDIMAYELATGSQANRVNDAFPTYSVLESPRQKFPKMAKLTGAKSLLLSIPGIMPIATTQDANTFEEMINDSINLKRSQRVMLNVVELGTLKEVFPDITGYTVPLYQCYQYGPCQYRVRHIVNVTPSITNYDNLKVYVNMKF